MNTDLFISYPSTLTTSSIFNYSLVSNDYFCFSKPVKEVNPISFGGYTESIKNKSIKNNVYNELENKPVVLYYDGKL